MGRSRVGHGSAKGWFRPRVGHGSAEGWPWVGRGLAMGRLRVGRGSAQGRPKARRGLAMGLPKHVLFCQDRIVPLSVALHFIVRGGIQTGPTHAKLSPLPNPVTSLF